MCSSGGHGEREADDEEYVGGGFRPDLEDDDRQPGAGQEDIFQQEPKRLPSHAILVP